MVILLNSVGETDDIDSSLTSDIVSLLVSDSFEVFFASKESKKKVGSHSGGSVRAGNSYIDSGLSSSAVLLSPLYECLAA